MLAPNFLNIFPFLGILHRCLETPSLMWLLLVKPIPERIKYRFFFFKTIGFSLLKCVLLVLWSALILKKLWTELDSLYCQIAVIILLSFWHRINEVSSCMSPAGAAPDTREIIITLITIRFQVSVRKTIKEINCIVSCLCFRVVVKDDRRQSIFTWAELPHERISFEISFGLLQYLYSCLICHQLNPIPIIIPMNTLPLSKNFILNFISSFHIISFVL